MPSTPPPGRKYFTFFTLDNVLQSAFLFALSALCTFSTSALAALIDVSSAWMTNSALGYLSCVFRSAFW